MMYNRAGAQVKYITHDTLVLTILRREWTYRVMHHCRSSIASFLFATNNNCVRTSSDLGSPVCRARVTFMHLNELEERARPLSPGRRNSILSKCVLLSY
jgi:hypothetical protein